MSSSAKFSRFFFLLLFFYYITSHLLLQLPLLILLFYSLPLSLQALLQCAVVPQLWGFDRNACWTSAPCCRAQEDAGEEAAEPVVERMLKDEIIRLTNIKASAKIRSVWSRTWEELWGDRREPVLKKRTKQNLALQSTVIYLDQTNRHQSNLYSLTSYTPLLRLLSDGPSACPVQVVSWRWRCCCRTTPLRPTAWRLQTRPLWPIRPLASRSEATAPMCARWPSARTTWPSSPPPGTPSKFGTGETVSVPACLRDVFEVLLSGGLTRCPPPHSKLTGRLCKWFARWPVNMPSAPSLCLETDRSFWERR